jgi:C-terminal processing protease CtpA/Prc
MNQLSVQRFRWPEVRSSSLLFSLFWLVISLFTACQTSKPQPPNVPTPLTRTYSTAQLQSDFRLMRRALEEAHPGLYRYYPRDTVARWFDAAYRRLDRPMTEIEFRRVIEPVIIRIGCGHTDLYASRAFTRYRKKHPLRAFPVEVTVLNNRLYVRANRSTDSTIRRGAEITAIDGRPADTVLSTIFQFISSDGYNQTFKPYVLNTGNFGSYYALAFGTDSTAQRLTFRDSTGTTRTLAFRSRPTPAKPRLDSLDKRNVPASKPRKRPKPDKKPDEERQLTFPDRDTTVAVLKITSFSGAGQRSFFSESFAAIAKRKGIDNLVVDLRGNLGGNSSTSLKLASYIIDRPFQAYTQVDAPVRQVSFNRDLGWKFWRFWIRHFLTRRTPEGTYRRRGVTRRIRPTKGGFRGRVFVLTNGGTFSAASIFASLVKHNVPDRTTIIGRETGGGEYGCNAFTSPYLTAPETGLQLRLPLYKIVLAIPGPDQGRGIRPDVPVAYTLPAVLSGQDLDMEKVYELMSEGL